MTMFLRMIKAFCSNSMLLFHVPFLFSLFSFLHKTEYPQKSLVMMILQRQREEVNLHRVQEQKYHVISWIKLHLMGVYNRLPIHWNRGAQETLKASTTYLIIPTENNFFLLSFLFFSFLIFSDSFVVIYGWTCQIYNWHA